MSPKHIVALIGIIFVVVGMVLPAGPNIYLIGAGSAVIGVAHFIP